MKTNKKMNFQNLIREQAVVYAALTTPEEKQAFLQTQLEALANFAPDEQIAHLKAIKTYAVELSSKIQQEKTSTLVA